MLLKSYYLHFCVYHLFASIFLFCNLLSIFLSSPLFFHLLYPFKLTFHPHAPSHFLLFFLFTLFTSLRLLPHFYNSELNQHCSVNYFHPTNLISILCSFLMHVSNSLSNILHFRFSSPSKYLHTCFILKPNLLLCFNLTFPHLSLE